MKLVLCSVKDRAADAYGRPMFVPSIGVAIRSFSDEVNRTDPDNQLNNHPDDFDLYYLGEFDDQSGDLITKGKPQFIVAATSFKKIQEVKE